MQKLIKFLVTGAAGVTVNLSIYFVLVEFFNFNYLVGSIVSFLVAVAYGFLMQKYWTFEETGNHGFSYQLVAYTSVSLLNLGINVTIVYFLVDRMGIYYLIAQFVAAGMVAVNSYVLYSRYIFVKSGQLPSINVQDSI